MDVGSRSITTTMPRLWPHSRVESIQRQNEACDPAAHSRLRPAIQAAPLNGSSCPQADLYVGAGIVWKRSFEPALGVSQSAASDKIAKLGLQEIEIDRLGDIRRLQDQGGWLRAAQTLAVCAPTFDTVSDLPPNQV